jgi:hypothetical protein
VSLNTGEDDDHSVGDTELGVAGIGVVLGVERNSRFLSCLLVVGYRSPSGN